VEGIRLGRELLERRGGEWDARLLRVVFPFPFRDLLEDEANRVDVDPYLLAGLVRQESSFNPRARSWVGATGLSQIMPATGEWLAPGAGVSNFDPSLLAVPEINLRMGARYLRDQLRRYGGKRDLALAAYNAGPSRADRWRRELGYGGDPDAFRERIPFAETREYVQLVLRNSVVYRRLYGGGRSPGLSAGGS
jgi:soluble lytic murein transglycosylase